MGLLDMRMNERHVMQRKGLKTRYTARSHFGCDRPHQEESVEAVTITAQYSQQSGVVGDRRIFESPISIKVSVH